MPTTRPRHTITETPSVQAALEQLRSRLDGGRIDYAELVVLGARAKLRLLPDPGQEARRARQELAGWVRNGTGPELDVGAAAEVKHRGLIANHDR